MGLLAQAAQSNISPLADNCDCISMSFPALAKTCKSATHLWTKLWMWLCRMQPWVRGQSVHGGRVPCRSQVRTKIFYALLSTLSTSGTLAVYVCARSYGRRCSQAYDY